MMNLIYALIGMVVFFAIVGLVIELTLWLGSIFFEYYDGRRENEKL